MTYVSPLETLISWKELEALARQGDPAWFTCRTSRGKQDQWAAIPKPFNGKIHIGRGSISRPKGESPETIIAAIEHRLGTISVFSAKRCLKVLVRNVNLSRADEETQRYLGKGFHGIALFIEEPISPDGRRCLFILDNLIVGGIDAEWALLNSFNVGRQTQNDLLDRIRSKGNLNMLADNFVLIQQARSSHHKARIQKAPTCWKAWKELADHYDK